MRSQSNLASKSIPNISSETSSGIGIGHLWALTSVTVRTSVWYSNTIRLVRLSFAHLTQSKIECRRDEYAQEMLRGNLHSALTKLDLRRGIWEARGKSLDRIRNLSSPSRCYKLGSLKSIDRRWMNPIIRNPSGSLTSHLIQKNKSRLNGFTHNCTSLQIL